MNEDLKTRPDFEKLANEYYKHHTYAKIRPSYSRGYQDCWTTHVEPLQAENQRIREALRKIHSMSYYKLSPEDYRDEYLPYELFDEIEQLLKLDKTNP